MVKFDIDVAAPRFAVVEMFGGDNNLSREIEFDLEEMRLGLPADAVVLALTDHRDSGAQVIRISKGVITELEKGQWGEIDTGDPAVLGTFLSRALISLPPATPIAIGFWDHGSGVFNEGGSKPVPDGIRGVKRGGRGQGRLFIPRGPKGDSLRRAMMNDDSSGGLLTTQEAGKLLAKSLAASGRNKVAAIFSDTCLNGMVEVLAELDPHAEAVIASAELEPATGWGYQTWLAMLAAGPVASVRFGETAVDAYRQTYEPKPDLYPCTLASFRPADVIISAFTEMVAAAEVAGAIGFSSLEAARFSCPLYSFRSSYDLPIFASNLVSIAKTDRLKAAAQDLLAATQAARIKNCALLSTGKPAEGLAFWYPEDLDEWALVSGTYCDLRFDQLTGWASYLGRHLPQRQ